MSSLDEQWEEKYKLVPESIRQLLNYSKHCFVTDHRCKPDWEFELSWYPQTPHLSTMPERVAKAIQRRYVGAGVFDLENQPEQPPSLHLRWTPEYVMPKGAWLLKFGYGGHRGEVVLHFDEGLKLFEEEKL